MNTCITRSCLIVTLATLLACSSAGSKLPVLTTHAVVDGPIAGAPTLWASTIDLAKVGYQQSEYFISGKARSFVNTSPLQSNGKWQVKVADEADFKTRFVVYRPISGAAFNGTVVFEWLNVSGGTDAASDWVMAHTELLRKGYAWVGVSAQKAGIDGVGPSMVGVNQSLKAANPGRYSSLILPGDSFSYDIYSQVAAAVLHPRSLAPLGDLRVRRALAVGVSQSAIRLATYVNAIAPLTRLFDGYLLQSRGAGSAKLSQSPQLNVAMPAAVFVRDDLGVPVLSLQTETDLFVLGSSVSRQPDSRNFRLWEVAGTAHADLYVLKGPADFGNDPDIAAVAAVAAPQPGLIECAKPVNSGPRHFVVKAAIAALDTWVRSGVAPTHAQRLEVGGNPPALLRDHVGNVLGGIRTPYVDVPIATLSGYGQGGPCSMFGSTELFDRESLARLYPDHAAYVSAVNKSVASAVANGFLLKPDGELIKAWADASSIGKR